MANSHLFRRQSVLLRTLSSTVIAIFLLSTCLIYPASAQVMHSLPKVGEKISLSEDFEAPLLKGVTIDPLNPLMFEFIIDFGDEDLSAELREQETKKIVKYFLAALTIPDNEVWVNLSPYEEDLIIPDNLGFTEMGRDMLAQDYLLKQITASLTHPEDKLGKKFWKKVYQRAFDEFGTTEIPVNTFNKVWVVPGDAAVLEKDGTVFIAQSDLTVMLEQDYLAIEKNLDNRNLGMDQIDDAQVQDINALSSGVVRDILLPELEREVNKGRNFALVRQVYNSIILATWYKLALKESLLGQIYVDQSKIVGVNVNDADIKKKIYSQYMSAFRKGVYNLIKDDYDQASKVNLSRRYFSGGFEMRVPQENLARVTGVADLSPVAQRNVEAVSDSIQRGSSRIGVARVGLETDNDQQYRARSSFVQAGNLNDLQGAIIDSVDSRIAPRLNGEINDLRQAAATNPGVFADANQFQRIAPRLSQEMSDNNDLLSAMNRFAPQNIFEVSASQNSPQAGLSAAFSLPQPQLERFFSSQGDDNAPDIARVVVAARASNPTAFLTGNREAVRSSLESVGGLDASTLDRATSDRALTGLASFDRNETVQRTVDTGLRAVSSLDAQDIAPAFGGVPDLGDRAVRAASRGLAELSQTQGNLFRQGNLPEIERELQNRGVPQAAARAAVSTGVLSNIGSIELQRSHQSTVVAAMPALARAEAPVIQAALGSVGSFTPTQQRQLSTAFETLANTNPAVFGSQSPDLVAQAMTNLGQASVPLDLAQRALQPQVVARVASTSPSAAVPNFTPFDAMQGMSTGEFEAAFNGAGQIDQQTAVRLASAFDQARPSFNSNSPDTISRAVREVAPDLSPEMVSRALSAPVLDRAVQQSQQRLDSISQSAGVLALPAVSQPAFTETLRSFGGATPAQAQTASRAFQDIRTNQPDLFQGDAAGLANALANRGVDRNVAQAITQPAVLRSLNNSAQQQITQSPQTAAVDLMRTVGTDNLTSAFQRSGFTPEESTTISARVVSVAVSQPSLFDNRDIGGIQAAVTGNDPSIAPLAARAFQPNTLREVASIPQRQFQAQAASAGVRAIPTIQPQAVAPIIAANAQDIGQQAALDVAQSLRSLSPETIASGSLDRVRSELRSRATTPQQRTDIDNAITPAVFSELASVPVRQASQQVVNAGLKQSTAFTGTDLQDHFTSIGFSRIESRALGEAFTSARGTNLDDFRAGNVNVVRDTLQSHPRVSPALAARATSPEVLGSIATIPEVRSNQTTSQRGLAAISTMDRGEISSTLQRSGAAPEAIGPLTDAIIGIRDANSRVLFSGSATEFRQELAAQPALARNPQFAAQAASPEVISSFAQVPAQRTAQLGQDIGFRQMPRFQPSELTSSFPAGIDTREATGLANTLIDIGERNPNIFSQGTVNDLRAELGNRGIPERLVSAATDTQTLSNLTNLAANRTLGTSRNDGIKGGIDFNVAMMDLEIKRDGNGVPLPINQQDLQNIDIQGLYPVIMDIQPAGKKILPFFS